jgi:hypothetical protein
MKKYGLFALLAFLVLACNDQNKAARVYLERAKTQYDNKLYASAKLSIDSIKILYPKALEVQKESLQMLRQVELSEQERNLAYCDSMLIVRKSEAEKMKSDFLFEKDPEYDDVGKYILKQQKLENNLQKSYLRTWTSEFGDLFMASVYYGSGTLSHDRLKISNSDGNYSETNQVPYDGGLNYRFVDLGMTTEVVSYSINTDNGVIMFIYANRTQALKADYLGGRRKYSLTISRADKDALIKTVDLSIVLSDIEQLKKEKEKAQKRIEYLQTKL